VLLCDTSELYRAGLRAVLGQMPDIAVVAEAGSVTGAVEAVERTRPDVVLIDLELPGGGALEVVRAAVRNDGRVLAMAPRIDADQAAEAIRCGAGGYLLREVPAAQLAAAVRLVGHGVAVLAGPVARQLGARPGNTLTPAQSALATKVSGLTARQLEVFHLMAGGLSNTEVARRLHVSEATVKSHVSALLRKLELRDRTQLVVFAHQRGERCRLPAGERACALPEGAAPLHGSDHRPCAAPPGDQIP
jgi:DNA-binding NarL/FixJ family response regulator